MTIKQKLIIALGSLSLIILLIGVFTASKLSTLDNQNAVFNEISEASTLFYVARLAQSEFLVSEDLDFAETVDKHIETASAKLRHLLTMIEVEESIAQVQTIIKGVDDYRAVFTALVANVDEDEDYEQKAVLINQVMATATSASDLMDKLLEEEFVIANDVRANVKTTVLVFNGLAIILSIGLGIWLINTVMRPLAQSSLIAEELSKGNFTYNTTIQGSDEFAILNKALLNSIASLRDTMIGIKTTLSSLDGLAQSLAEDVSNSSESMNKQQAETDQLATAIEEMAAATSEIAQNAEKASSASHEAELETKTGDQVMLQAKTSMSGLSNEMQKASGVVSKLDNDSKDVANIVQVIMEIAEQTNLLALNAAIEAARAGEQGRGFAVVADEVRNLAKRTQDSTAEITAIVDMIQKGATDVVSAIESSSTQSDEVAGLNDQAAQAYQNISGAVNDLSAINSQVAVGATEQSHVTSELSSNVSKIKALADENTLTLQQINERASEQRAQATELKKRVDFFHV